MRELGLLNINNEEKKGIEKQFIKKILDDEYIDWLECFINKYGEFDDIYFIHNNKHVLNEQDIIMINYLKYLFKELNKYSVNKDMSNENIFAYQLSYNNSVYLIEYNGEGYSFIKINNKDRVSCIDYNDLKKSISKNMQVNFDLLKYRVFDSLSNTDLEYIRYELSKLNESTLFSGVGGSSVVSDFASKVINAKNRIITVNTEPRDFLYRNNNYYKNVVACSYSGNNYGVKISFLKNIKKYLLSNNSFDDEDVTYLKYNTSIAKEKSFISLGATLIPVSVMLDYYINGDDKIILDSIEEENLNLDIESNIYEIFSGYDTSTSSTYLESTMVESGIGIPIVHDKYSYCHGRSTFGINYNATAIYYNRNTEFDKMMLEELKKYYKTVITINAKFKDQILDDFQMLIQSMYLSKYIAEKKKKDLSKIKYSPIVKKLYKYNREI